MRRMMVFVEWRWGVSPTTFVASAALVLTRHLSRTTTGEFIASCELDGNR